METWKNKQDVRVTYSEKQMENYQVWISAELFALFSPTCSALRAQSLVKTKHV